MKLTPMNRWLVAGVAFGVSAAVLGGVAYAQTLNATNSSTIKVSMTTTSSPDLGGLGSMGSSSAMMGSSSTMMGSSGGREATLTNAGLFALVSQGEQGASIDQNTNTVTYTGRIVTLVALASPHGKPNMTWEIDGLVNPTIVMRPGTQVDVVLANTDWGYMHGFELTATPPPYPSMAMAGVTSDFFLMPLPPRTTRTTSSARYYTRSANLITTSGTYHYLCPVPGHAAMGMFGTIVVS